MKEESVLEKWKILSKKEEKENPFDKFVIDEGEFVEVKSGVMQLDIRELSEEKDTENGSSNSNGNISKQ